MVDALKVAPSTDGSSQKGSVDASLEEKAVGTLSSQFKHINERKLLFKIDVRVLSVLAIVYFTAFLDRVNIGNAAVFGLKPDLGLTGNQYNTALVITFVPYILFEIPSNVLLKRLRPHLWLSLCAFGFGLVTIFQGFAQNYSGILAARFFLGVFESGILPGCYYLTSMWYKREEAQKRFTFLFSAIALAGAFGGLLASAIGKMSGMRGMLGWRWVFILEGVLTCLIAAASYFLISDFPEQATWLSDEEKEFMKAKLKEDVGESGIDEKVTLSRFFAILKDYKVFVAGLMYFGLVVPAYSFVYFAPSILQTLGHSPIRTQLLSVPPYACGFVYSMTVAFASDYFKHRFLFALVSALMSLVGYAALLSDLGNNKVEYAMLFLGSTGVYAAMPIVLCWYSMNVRGHVNRAVAGGWQLAFGNIGGIVASYAFVASDAPKYLHGYLILVVLLCVSIVGLVAYYVIVKLENRRLIREGNTDPTLNLDRKPITEMDHAVEKHQPRPADSTLDEKDGSINFDEEPLQRFPDVDNEKLLRKIDLRLVPVLSTLYVLAFLDRVNIGNAAIFGLKQDLNLTGDQFNTALVIFFVPFAILEVPSNILLKRLQPHIWLTGCIFAFGLITILQGLTQNYAGLLTRFFLGKPDRSCIFESGMLPGCFYLMSMWYKRDEAQKRYTFLFSGCTLAGAFGGLLASAIGKMDGMRGLLGWRWVFILEGLLTCVASFFFFFLIPNFPEKTTWLSQEEKAFLHAKLKADVGSGGEQDTLSVKRVITILGDYKVILAGFQYFGLVVTAYSFVYFTPTIILDYGHGPIETQLLSVPPYACAFVVAMVASAISDRLEHRFFFAIGGVFLTIAGQAILNTVHHNTNLQYAALFMVASGNYTTMPIVLCWFSMNVRGHLERGISIGWQIGFGGIGGIISSYAFLAKDAPEYRTGYRICIAFQCVTALAITLYYIGVSFENRRQKTDTVDQLEGGDSDSIVPFRYYT
ncbi:hypothetical protein EIP91_003267 [Steccherinum ochraceum]|uniref:Major facilitator superfamily (MFS) profile domain-containing protein n=1 Tax=Steccherinum ochraceum TaxID=92696 RepID=A0A4R0RRR8_9APHY|nr:hypothetical protein EIP91_003267 [Steccherinum ochraceum]